MLSKPETAKSNSKSARKKSQQTQRSSAQKNNVKPNVEVAVEGIDKNSSKNNLEIASRSSQRSKSKISDNLMPLRSASRNSKYGPHICVKCEGREDKRPCKEYIDILRDEFTILIENLFRKRMQEFIDFIEDTLEVTDQVDVNKDHVIDSFYREHNTLNKMNENFRLRK